MHGSESVQLATIFIILFSICILAAIENQVDKSSQVLSQEFVEAIGEHQILCMVS